MTYWWCAGHGFFHTCTHGACYESPTGKNMRWSMTRKGQNCAPLKSALSLFYFFLILPYSQKRRSMVVVFIVLSLLCFTMTYISKHEHQQEDWPSPSNYFTVVILNACHRIGIWLIRVRWVIKFKLLRSGVLRVTWGVSTPQERNRFEVRCVSSALKQSLLCHTITILAISLAYSRNLTQIFF